MHIATRFFSFAAVCAIGLFAGVLLAEGLVRTNAGFENAFDESVDGWRFSTKIGSAAAGPIQRARIARGGPLALSAKETIYFFTNTDRDDEPLRSNCRYELRGGPLPARWWSITIYDSETQNYPNAGSTRASWNSVEVGREANGEWVIVIADNTDASNYLPTPTEPNRRFDLILRLYNPENVIRNDIHTVRFPSIHLVSCDDVA